MGSLPNEIDTFLSTNFTHLVIGGGTAGLVVASRLAENKDITVGVLEAGHAAFDHPGINVPGRFGETLATEHDWQFATVPQPGLNGRSLPWPRGKVLGGSSALNFMTWNRACREDYDAWEELGCDGWAWEALLPYFMKTEHLHESSPSHQATNSSYFNPKFHGRDGPIHSAYSTQYGASHQHWHKTLNSLGVETNRSHFGGSNVGAWTSLTSVEPEQRERSYSATAYYRPNAGKANLVVLTGATVQEILLKSSSEGGWSAKGARFAYEGSEHSVPNVSGEIILCGGSVSSPQLLELSGIGNPDILKAAGIEVKVVNPAVGENLQEHMMTMMVYEIDPSIPTLESLRTSPYLAAAADHEYETTRSGLRTVLPSSVAYLPFSHYLPSTTLSQIIATLPPSTPKTDHRHKREAILRRRFTHDQNLGQIEYSFDLSNYSAHYPSEPGKKYATMLQMLQYPFSTGCIHIPPSRERGKPTTVDEKPLIDPKYYEGGGGAVDLEMMSQAQRFADRIVKTAPLREIIVKRVWPPLPPSSSSRTSSPSSSPGLTTAAAASARERSSQQETIDQRRQQSSGASNREEEEEDFSAWVRVNTVTDWHPVGTCAMGGASARDGYVVDARLRVYGVRGLRVVDASVMPLQISAHLQATVYAIGEKGAAMIREDWEREKERERG